MKKVWNVAIYARVSSDKKEQQESIPAQVESLKKWLIDKSKLDTEVIYNLVEVYEDQGFSGSNFERDSFIKMKGDIEQGKINMVLTRDLSRFGRNYIMAGYYLEDFFKINGVRFISTLDAVDTLEEVNDIIPFKNILNEMYIKDCSRRVKDALKQRMIRGSSIASKAPFGYRLQEEYNGNIKTITLVSAEDETSDTVKEIFKLYLGGWGVGRIATYLNSRGILPPSSRLENFGRSKFGIWTNNGVKSILTNPKYAGIMVQGRWKKVSYKVNKVKVTPESEWIYGGQFEGIISKEVFEEVQKQIKARAKNLRYKDGEVHLFSSILKCAECGGSMSFRKKYKGYKCTNSQMGGGRCTTHSVKEEDLKNIITKDLHRYVEYINKDELYDGARELANKTTGLSNTLKKIESELNKLDRQFEKLYMDKLNDLINERNFEMIIKKVQARQEELSQKKQEIVEQISSNNSPQKVYEVYEGKINRILGFQQFDRMILESLINNIEVSEDKKTREKRITINYKFRMPNG
ncbi:recombinase family protein [Clostridium sp. C8-1-8]|uniref:recombinase family protein n=1 Tax=Clostridium sp. C8-1-8 TaxID=2698831 RepID=UPI00136A0D9D|nr:recombinase family protein [Clostridium sp. C8-1-8]